MRLRDFVVGGALLCCATAARADTWSRVFDAGGGGGPAPASTAAPPTPDLTAWAGESEATSLPDLLKFSVQHAPNLQSASLDIAIADARVQELDVRSDWFVKAQVQATRYTQLILGAALPVTSVQGSVDFTHTFITGGTVDLHADTGWSKSDGGALFGGTSSAYSTNVTGSITQPLLRGYGHYQFDANAQKAVLSRDVYVLARRLAAIQTIQNVISAYWDLVLAERGVAITQASLDLAKERLRVTTAGAEGGKTPRSEIPAVQQIIATREEDVLNGELNVLNASIALRRAAGMPIGKAQLGLRVATELEIKDGDADLGGLLDRAFAASPELAEVAKQDQSSQIDLKVTENQLLPQLDATLTIGPEGSDAKLLPSLRKVVEFDGYTVTGQLTFSRSFEQSDVRGRQREFQETREKLAVNAADLRANIAQTMTRAVAQLELAKRRVSLAQQAIDLANQNIQIETNRFNLGKSTNFDVLNRLEDLRQAELRKAQAMVDWHKAEVVVQALTGDLLPAYGISVDS